jgi:hypothetical protein
VSFSIVGGHPLLDDALVGRPAPYPDVAPDVVEGNYLVDFNEPTETSKMWESACQSPTPWKFVSASTVRGTTFFPISRVYGPSAIDETVTLISDRTVTKGVEIQGGVGWSVGVLEAQTHVKLDGSVTTRIGETETFRIPRGKSVHLLAQIIYRQSILERTNFAGPNCRLFQESLTVLTPINTATIIAWAK